MARPFSAELKVKVRKDTGCRQIPLQQPRGSSGLRTECEWGQEGKDKWKKMEPGRRVGGWQPVPSQARPEGSLLLCPGLLP